MLKKVHKLVKLSQFTVIEGCVFVDHSVDSQTARGERTMLPGWVTEQPSISRMERLTRDADGDLSFVAGQFCLF